MSGMLRALCNPVNRRSSHSRSLCSRLGSLRLLSLDQPPAWSAPHEMNYDATDPINDLLYELV